MKTKQDFLAEYADKLMGMFVSSFVQSENMRVDTVLRAKHMQALINGTSPFLEKMYDFIAEVVKEPEKAPEMTINEQTNMLMRSAARLSNEQKILFHKSLTEKIKPFATTTPVNGANGVHKVGAS